MPPDSAIEKQEVAMTVVLDHIDQWGEALPTQHCALGIASLACLASGRP